MLRIYLFPYIATAAVQQYDGVIFLKHTPMGVHQKLGPPYVELSLPSGLVKGRYTMKGFFRPAAAAAAAA